MGALKEGALAAAVWSTPLLSAAALHQAGASENAMGIAAGLSLLGAATYSAYRLDKLNQRPMNPRRGASEGR